MFPNKNIKNFLNYWLGPIIFIWLAWSIYRQVTRQPDLGGSWSNILQAISGEQGWKCWLALLLVVVNWGLEAIKWKELVGRVTRISFLRAFVATLAGVSFAVNTPNRIGEYGGRVLYLPEGKRLEAVSLTLIGSFAQLLVTLLMGAAGLWIWQAGWFYGQDATIPAPYLSYNWLLKAMTWLITALAIGGFLFYIRISWLVRWVEKVPAMAKWGKPVWVLDNLPVTILLRVFGWSLVRYLVFIFQYILLLQSLQVTGNWWMAFWLTALQFLVLAIIPTIALAELGLRGKLSLELFGWISSNALGILATTVSIWLLNLIIPAIIGSILIIRVKVFDPVKTEGVGQGSP
ncbi:flippase-like domain-containing protein [Flavihumibacter rivuli]|uniref:lysylphosphatidylglycerol synthase domain-containing protein n=1 Tax=Flavihumibacter rivuli TaxID=2838156 RepID=UPI001BDEE394|nr:lysylphosphatidylglycerol synthase domain-containing protein [Flavihumibacter rivuli]ULQ56383.1 flippase-like domain-containing protein [Flavihumibacter rivuli]